jgi:hypothetical protein
MNRLQRLQRAVRGLSPDDLAVFRQWFQKHDTAHRTKPAKGVALKTGATGSVGPDATKKRTPRSPEMEELWQRLLNARKLFYACYEKSDDPGGVDFPPLALFGQMIQMAEGVFCLAEAMCLHPARPLLRTMLECYYGIQYIIGQDADCHDWRNRSHAWWVFCLNQEIELRERLDESTGRGRPFFGDLRAHGGNLGHRLCDYARSGPSQNDSIQALRDRLNQSDLFSLNQVYQKDKPKCFAGLVDKKVTSIMELARYSGQLPFHSSWYKQLSHTVHAAAPLLLLKDDGEGNAVFTLASTPQEQTECARLAEALLHFAGGALDNHYKSFGNASG